MLGIGGGIIFVPSLYILLPLLGYDPSIVAYAAIATSLLAGAIAASFSGYLYYKNNNLDLKRALLLSTGSALSAFIFPFFVIQVNPVTLKIIFAIVMFTVAIKMLSERTDPTGGKTQRFMKDTFLPAIGIFAGSLSAFTGLGGGVVYFPSLYYLYNLKIKKAVGTSAVVTAATMISASIAFIIQDGGSHNGYVSLAAGIPMGLGAIVGARSGVNFVLKIKPVFIKKIFSIILIIVVIKIILNLW